jgi:hypothetical protein
VPLGSEYVVSLCACVFPLTELDEYEVLKDWNVELLGMLGGCYASVDLRVESEFSGIQVSCGETIDALRWACLSSCQGSDMI